MCQLILTNRLRLIGPAAEAPESVYRFADRRTRETAYQLMLLAQRRQLHRAVAEHYERVYAGNLAPHYGLLAYHWPQAADSAKAIRYLEEAGKQARQSGAHEEALRYFNE